VGKTLPAVLLEKHHSHSMRQLSHKSEKLTGFYQQMLVEYKQPFSIDLIRDYPGRHSEIP